MRNSATNVAIRQFFKTTTLHGFKYLCSEYFIDRICWVLCCCMSAACAGLLCVVLWARFIQMPALLTLHDWGNREQQFTAMRMPAVAVCPPADSIAYMFVDELSPNRTVTKRLPVTLYRLLSGRSTAKDQLLLLDQLLTDSDKTLPQVIEDFTPDCSEMMQRCRYQKTMVPCGQLFEKEMVSWRHCCVMRPDKLSNISMVMDAQFQTNQLLELVVQCTNGSILYGCEVIPMYEGEEGFDMATLLAGSYHLAQLRFMLIPESTDDKLVKKDCISDESYSRTVCMNKCAEKICGCSNPFTYVENHKNELPPCSVTRLSCLSAFKFKNYESCHCLLPCKKLSSYMVLESYPMNVIEQVIDPFYVGLNVTPVSVLSLQVNVVHSRIFVLNPTETWLTLLSSMGGIFNMFLGVGLFSALEFLYFMLVKLPIAIRKSSEVDLTRTPVVLY